MNRGRSSQRQREPQTTPSFQEQKKKLPGAVGKQHGEQPKKIGADAIVTRPAKKRKGYYTMSENTIISKAREIRELEALIAEAQAQADALKDEIKTFMGDREELRAGEYKITWKTVTSTRLDTTAIKKLFSAEDLEGFTKTTTTRRFSIA